VISYTTGFRGHILFTEQRSVTRTDSVTRDRTVRHLGFASATTVALRARVGVRQAHLADHELVGGRNGGGFFEAAVFALLLAARPEGAKSLGEGKPGFSEVFLPVPFGEDVEKLPRAPLEQERRGCRIRPRGPKSTSYSPVRNSQRRTARFDSTSSLRVRHMAEGIGTTMREPRVGLSNKASQMSAISSGRRKAGSRGGTRCSGFRGICWANIVPRPAGS